eukprot:10368145-Heterocapsa_arctica.AAC.1
MYENIDDAERVHEAAELIAERGGLQTLKANLYVTLWVLEHIAPDEWYDIWMYMRDKLRDGCDGVGGWSR